MDDFDTFIDVLEADDAARASSPAATSMPIKQATIL
jgi:hypothetical protein